MSRVQVDSGVPLRKETPQTQVVDTFVGLKAPGPQLHQPAELPRWQSELFEVAQALGGMSASLDNLSQTWGGIAVKAEDAVGKQMVADMTPEQQRDASAMSWAEFEKKNPAFKGASPFRRLAIRQAAGKTTVEQSLGKILSENADRLSDPASTEDARAFGTAKLQEIVGGINTFYGREAGTTYGADLVDKFSSLVEEAKRKRTVLANDQNFQSEVRDLLNETLAADELPVDYGTRPDGSKKGSGWLGPIKVDEKDPNSKVMTELSVGVLIDGKERDVPLLVPTLTPEEIAAIRKAEKEGTELPASAVAKASAHAQVQLQQGRSVWAPTLADKLKAIQDKYHTITGDSGNLAVFQATVGLAETLIASGRYEDARELVRGMSDYTHNGEITFGKMYSEQFAEIIDKADHKQQADTTTSRTDTAYRLGQAASNALFNIDAEKMGAMTEGDIKALATKTTEQAGFGPEQFGEMYDTLLAMRDGQLQRLNKGRSGDGDDLRLMMDIRRRSMQPGTNLDELEEEVQKAFTAGVIKKDTAMSLLGQVETARNHYGDNAAPLVQEQRARVSGWMNPATIPNTALPEFMKITSDLRAQFDDRMVAAREEVMAELAAKKIPVNTDSINHMMGDKARVIADEIMKGAEKDFADFRGRFEPKARMKEYLSSSTMLGEMIGTLKEQMDTLAAKARETQDMDLVTALDRDKAQAQMYLRDKAKTLLEKHAAEGLSGQDLYDAVDTELLDVYNKTIKPGIERLGSPTGGTIGKPTDPHTKEWPFWESASQQNIRDRNRDPLLPVPEASAVGFTQSMRFGNEFRDWVEELGEKDPAKLKANRDSTRSAAEDVVKQTASPKANGIVIQGSNITRGGAVDQDATATYWNAKIKWAGLTIAEVASGTTTEGLTIPEHYKLSPHTRIKGLDTEKGLREALVQFEVDGTGVLAEYLNALPSHYPARSVVDFLRTNLHNTGLEDQ